MDALTLVSYNISFAESSFVAPNRALRTQEASRLIREECLRSRPDIIALQECPNESWGGLVFGPDYVSMGTQLASHVQGHIDLLVRRELAQHAQRITLEHPAFPLPSVAAAIMLPNGTRIVACSLHLPHTAEGATARELMCEAIMQIISQKCSNCILIGDLNMRKKEDQIVECLAGGGWIDVWKEATGEDGKLKFSWDSRTNLFHEPGPNSFQFIARFDRCYVRGNELAATRFDLIGNQPIDGKKGDYLSDHYGIVVTVGVRPSSSSNIGVKLGVKKASGNENTNRSNTHGADKMVDLTGDSDSDDDEGGMTSIRKSHGNGNCNNSGNNVKNNAVAKSNGGKISNEEMRRLRLQKFSGTSMASMVQKSSANDSQTIEPSTSASSSSLLTFNPTTSSRSDKAACKSEDKGSTQVADVAGDIEPVKPTNFPVVDGKPKRYIIYMAIREKNNSRFSNGLAKCNAVCHEGISNCLQMDGTRHVTMFDGNLTSDQVHKLTFNGRHFDPLEMKLDGWQPWDAGCYLKLNEESEDALQGLLGKIVGLPLSGGKRPCDHLSLYRKRPQTKHPNPKREFGKIREATRSLNWGSVEGNSIRIKAFGGPYDECMILAGSRNNARERDQRTQALCSDTSETKPTKSNDAKETTRNSKQPHKRNDQWNDECDSDGDKNPIKNEEERETIEAATFRDYSSSNSSNIILSIVSWNISETSLNSTSAAAPDPALRAQESARLIREECLRPHFASQQQNSNSYLPDIIALQESQDGWGTEVFGPSGYVSMGTQHSHCGSVDLLIRKDFASERIWLKKEGTTGGGSLERNDHSRFDDLYQQELPSVAAIVTLPNKTRVAVASNHLEPFASGASSRAQQCKLLMELLIPKCKNVILIGDMNMRQKEDSKIENLVGLDAWKEGSGSSKKLKFSWDSNSNLYHLNGFGFTARFDRAYVRGKELGVSKFGLVGNQPVNGTEGDYLSDHFGLIVEVNAAPSSGNDGTKVKMAAKGDRYRKRTAKSRRLKDDRVTNSRNDSKESSNNNRDANRDTSQLPQSPKSETALDLSAQSKRSGADGHRGCASSSASVQEQELDHKLRHKNEEQYDGWGSDDDDKMGSEETPRRTNGKRARSATATTAKSMTTKSNNATQLTAVRESIKEKCSKAKAKKRFKFESSSSEDDCEEMMRRLQEKLGKKYKKRKLPHLSNDSSSDED